MSISIKAHVFYILTYGHLHICIGTFMLVGILSLQLICSVYMCSIHTHISAQQNVEGMNGYSVSEARAQFVPNSSKNHQYVSYACVTHHMRYKIPYVKKWTVLDNWFLRICKLLHLSALDSDEIDAWSLCFLFVPYIFICVCVLFTLSWERISPSAAVK